MRFISRKIYAGLQAVGYHAVRYISKTAGKEPDGTTIAVLIITVLYRYYNIKRLCGQNRIAFGFISLTC